MNETTHIPESPIAGEITGDAAASAGEVWTVGFVVHTFHMGGLERSVARLANHLDRRSFRPVVFCLNRTGAAQEWLEVDDVRIVEVKKKKGNDPGAVRRFARLLREHGVDLVHSHNWGTLVETSIARRRAGVAVHVHAERGTLFSDLNVRGWKRRLRAHAARWAMNRADAVVSVADAVRERMERHCGPLKHDIRVIANGVDRPAAGGRDVRAELGIDPAAHVLGSVGRLVEVKNFGIAIDAVRQLRAEGRDVHLILVGDGPDRESLIRSAAEEGVEDAIHVVGQQVDVGNWLAGMDVFLNTSLSEGMSQSILEAMACGLPLVVTDVGANRLLVGEDDGCGRIVPSDDSAALALAVAGMLDDGPGMQHAASAASARHRQHFSVDVMVEHYETLYRQLLLPVRRSPGTEANATC